MIEQHHSSDFHLHPVHNDRHVADLERFVQALAHAGYSQRTVRSHVSGASHLAHWADQNGIPAIELDEGIVQRFDKHLRSCHCRGFSHACRLELLRGARAFLSFVSGAGVGITHRGQRAKEVPPLIREFFEWMKQYRGTSTGSLHTYGYALLDLLRTVGEDTTKFDAQGLRQFVLERNRRSGMAAAKTCVTALRMFLRFLISQGRCRVGLDAAIPSVANWKLSSLPRYLQPEAVERVIASCDRNSSSGIRDRAILLLLARLGLRAGDIVTLCLADIDWKNASLRVCGKTKRETTLPLTQEVGQAIVDYLQTGRPACEVNAIFVRSHAPVLALKGHWAISLLVQRAIRRAGVQCQSRSAAHLFRHSAATSMLRHGATLQDISSVLRHSSINTTQIY